MSGNNKIGPNSYIGLDVLTGRQRDKKKQSANQIETPDIQFICPLHGKVKNGKVVQRQKQQTERQQNDTGFISYMRTFFGKSDLEQKLATYGLKVKIKKSALRAVQTISKESDLFSWEELVLLSTDKLQELSTSFEHEIAYLNSEMMSLQEDQQTMTSENKRLKKESKELEENVKTMLRPWINRFPHSDDLTRAYLIN